MQGTTIQNRYGRSVVLPDKYSPTRWRIGVLSKGQNFWPKDTAWHARSPELHDGDHGLAPCCLPRIRLVPCFESLLYGLCLCRHCFVQCFSTSFCSWVPFELGASCGPPTLRKLCYLTTRIYSISTFVLCIEYVYILFTVLYLFKVIYL